MGKRQQERQRAQAIAAARGELAEMENAMQHACSVFNNCADQALVEAAILEMRAIQTRYGRQLKRIREL